MKCHFIPPAYEDGTDRVFRNVGIYNSDAGELPKRKHNISQNMPSQRLNAAFLPLHLACSGLITHSGEIPTTGKSHQILSCM